MSLELGFWGEAVLNNLAAWLTTYLVYSTVALGAVAGLARIRAVPPETENRLWRIALLLSPLAATARIGLEHLQSPPVVSGPEAIAVAGAAGSVLVAVAVVATGVAALLTGQLGRLVLVARTRLADRESIRDGEELEILSALAREAGRPVPVLTRSGTLSGPVALGSREICIPADGFDALPFEVRRAMIAHELGHLARRDSTWVTAAHVLERLFFLQPLHRIARRRLRETAEFVADAYAVRLTGEAEPLVAGLAALIRTPSRPLAASAFAPGSLLLRRVERMLGRSDPPLALPGWVWSAFAWSLGVVVWLTPAAVPAYDCRVTGALPEVASWFLLHL